MHREFNAFLLLALIGVGSLIVTLPHNVAAASSPVKFGILLWNYNSTHVVPNADVSLMNGTSVKASGSTNQTGWVNLTAPNPGAFTLQIKLQQILVFNATKQFNQTTTFINLTGVNVADYAFILTDRLSRQVQNVQIDVKVNSSLVASAISAANGTAVARNLPFHSYNITAFREQVFVANQTLTVNSTTYNRNTLLTVPSYNYTLSVRDYKGAKIVHNGIVGVYDWEVSTNNATNPLDTQVIFRNLWPGKYWVVVTSSNATIWRSLETIKSNMTKPINANIGYTITLHVFDALNRPIPSVPVNLIQNGIIIGTARTDASGTVAFTNLPVSIFQLNVTLLGKFYVKSAVITGSSAELSFKLDDVIILGGALFNTAPLVASLALILTLIAVIGTVLLYRRRRGMATTSKEEGKEKESSPRSLPFTT